MRFKNWQRKGDSGPHRLLTMVRVDFLPFYLQQSHINTLLFFSFINRKPKREEHLSEEAIKVIASLPDLTFMHAKVLMFPATLTPSTSSQEKAD